MLNPKSEANSKSKFSNIPNTFPILVICIFEFVSGFDIRISNFQAKVLSAPNDYQRGAGVARGEEVING
jgi:hypothetical protein